MQRALKCETLPVRLNMRRVHAVYVTESEDNQPLLPGVSQNVGCARPLRHPASHLPAQPWSLQFVSAAAAIAPPSSRGEGCWMTWIMSTCFEGGWQYKCAHIHPRTVILYTPSLWNSLPHILSCTHTHARAAHMQTPCGDFGNPSSDPKVSSQSRTKAHHHRLLLNPRGRVPFLSVCSSQD